MRDFRPAIKEIFGTGNAIATWEFPSHIEHLVRNLDSGHCYGTEDIIFNHTMLPLYYPFLDIERQKYALEHMKSNNGKGIHMKLGVMASKIKTIISLKCCPLCIAEDIEQHGVAYWHRSHNAPGTIICYKHSVLLRDSCPECGVVIAPKSKNVFFALEDNCTNGHFLTSVENDNCQNHNIELRIAKAINYLLSNDLQNHNAMSVQETYIRLLYKKNLITPKGIIRQAELIQQFKGYYGESFLQRMGLNFDTKCGESWLSSLIRTNKVSHPLKHILLINFLVGDMFLFFEQSKEEYYSFGKAPWLCLNPVADHYKKPIITKCSVSWCSDTQKAVGTFECECGFVYSRKGPDTCTEDKFKIGRIKSFGTVWEKKLRSIAQEKDRSLRSMAREMKADTNTVKKHLYKLEFEEICSQSQSVREKYDELILHNKLAKIYAGRIVNYLEENSLATRTMVQHRLRKEYTWLYRHNKELLYSILPKPTIERVQNNYRVDWVKKDSEIFAMVKKEIHRIFDNTEKLERVTIGRIGKNLGLLPIMEQHLDKLPKTKKLLNKFAESVEDFQLRRATAVINQMLLQKEDIRSWVVFRKAGLGDRCSDKVKQTILEMIESANKTSYISGSKSIP